MFERSIRESKAQPDFSGTDDYQVFLTLPGEVQDPRFLEFFEKIGAETLSTFSTQDFLVVDLIHRDQTIPPDLHACLPKLLDLGVVESQGGGNKKRYFLSRRFYGSLGQKGTYSRKRGLDKQTNKELLVKHIEDSKAEGARSEEFAQVLPSLSRYQIHRLVKELEEEARVHSTGRTKGTRWYPGPPQDKGIALQDSFDAISAQ